MATILLIGTGAGLVSALLFGVVATMSPLGLLLSYVAPLPVLIAALGWNHRTGLVASAAGAAVCAVFLAPSAGAVFAVAVALPAWWLAYLALLGRADDAGRIEWYPLGRLLIWMAGTAALITLIGAIALGPSYGEYRGNLEALIRAVIGAELTPAMPVDADVEQFVGLVTAVVPAIAAMTFVFMLTINLWLAAVTVRVSGRLPRPWPSLPDMLMPRSSLLAAAAATVGAVVLPDYAGLTATSILGALSAAFALQGLAAAHAATRGNRARPALLALLYLSLLLLSVWVLVILAGAGAATVAWKSRPAGKTGPPESGP
ncbi:MAG: DUF2232 domain-containing protein [Pseudochelatococcus sp.]|jgi:hypothetical protein|uniref:DUF2232 domain-containing protein n=1 Tax=Pseudochelatococcus sp. TaxID=2020869 RepID=UPI003D8F305A